MTGVAARSLRAPSIHRGGRKQNTPQMVFDHYEENAGGCWIWLMRTDADGYGRFKYAGKVERAHVVAWLVVNGDIPENMTIDHTCTVKSCINPEHMRLLSNRDNILDARAREARVIECKWGHRGAWSTGPNGRRYCKECTKMRSRKWRSDGDTR